MRAVHRPGQLHHRHRLLPQPNRALRKRRRHYDTNRAALSVARGGEECLLRLTTSRVKYGEDGELTTTAHRHALYKVSRFVLMLLLLLSISLRCNTATTGSTDPTAVLVARGANSTAPRPRDPTPFSSVYATDDALTEGPERGSRVVGSVQGLYVSSGKAALSLVMGMGFELTDYGSGSSFVVYSRNPVATGDGRELAIVGGRGAFRMARGFALLRTHYLDTGNGDAIIEYNVTVAPLRWLEFASEF